MYDLIGDIHGHAKPLASLLHKLGYQLVDGCYRQKGRQIIFLGDFIDRGPNQKDVLDIVMPMVKNGNALAVMGNHEFNALAFHTSNPHKQGSWLRPRNDKNLSQHMAFLTEYYAPENKGELSEVLAFFWSLPLWLDLGDMRVIHACWDPNSINYLKPLLNPNHTLTEQLLIEASTEGTEPFNTVETILKGKEISLPAGCSLHDKDGNEHHRARVRWWLNKDTRLDEATLLPPGTDLGSSATDIVSATELGGYGPHEPAIFFGHYWFTGKPQAIRSNIACLDYSIANSGKLVAYSWDGEKLLNDESLTWVGSDK